VTHPAALQSAVVPGIRPVRTLWLLACAHAVNHAEAVLLPLVYLRILDEYHVGADAIAFLAAAGSLAAGIVQLAYGWLTRVVQRRPILGVGGLVMGVTFAAQALAREFVVFAVLNITSRIGGSPQHPVGNGLLAEQFEAERRGFAISAHIAGGNVGTVVGVLAGTWLLAGLGWHVTVVLFGIPAALVAIGVLLLVRETGADRAAAVAQGSVGDAYRRIRRTSDLLWLYLGSALAGGGRGLGVVNLFALLYLTRVVGVPQGTAEVMYAVLILFSVPAPLVAGWLSDRWGRKRLIVGVYIGGAIGFAVFILAGSNLAGLWLGIVLMGIFSFAESPQLQALLADLSPPAIRDVAFATYFTLAFGVGSLWVAAYGFIIDSLGEAAGLSLTFWMMAGSFVLAAIAVVPIGAGKRAAEAAVEIGP
jgi:MFS family permease